MVSTRLMSSVGVSCSSAIESTSSNSQTNGPPPAKIPKLCSAASGSAQTVEMVDNLPGTSKEPPKSVDPPSLLDMPHEVIEKIFSFLPFKNVAHLRPVCHTLDQICGTVLNTTFQRLQKQMLIRFQNIKAKMPRRESARRNHPLACESDIIETLHMRLTLLQMSFGKHIERRHCCFFAGEVLDEVYRILHYVKKTTKLQRPYKVTDELFDLSSMAMEYFKEHIEPRLPEIAYFSSDFLDFTGGTFTSTNNSKNYLCLDSSPLGAGSGCEQKGDETPSHPAVDTSEQSYMPSEPLPQSNMVLRKRIRKIKQGMKRYNSQLSLLRQDLRTCKRKTAEQQKQIAEQQRQLAEQQKQTLEYATRLDENDKKNEETSRKFSTLLQELNKCKTELQYWRSKSPAIPPVCKGCGAVFSPGPPEDIQALVNQGVRSEGLGLIIDEMNTSPDETESIELPTQSLDITTDNIIEQQIMPSTPPQSSRQGVKRKATITSDEVVPIPIQASTPMEVSSIGSEPSRIENKKVRRISKSRTKRAPKLAH